MDQSPGSTPQHPTPPPGVTWQAPLAPGVPPLPPYPPPPAPGTGGPRRTGTRLGLAVLVVGAAAGLAVGAAALASAATSPTSPQPAMTPTRPGWTSR